MSYFVYRSLTPHKERIRLINLLPEVQSPVSTQSFAQHLSGHPIAAKRPICCTISHVSLDNAPPYNALSYNWGDPSHRCEIVLDGATISITKSLEMALRHLRLPDKPRTMWIDDLCIDQKNDAEKSEQIAQMRQIYSKAYSVIAWLGPAANDSDVAMRWIQRYGGWAFKLGIGSRPELHLRHLLEIVDSRKRASINEEQEKFVQDLKTQLSEESAEQLRNIAALDSLFIRSYWGRVWVVQELVSARRVLFVCGTEAVTEEPLHHSLRLLRNFRRYHTLNLGHNKSPSELQKTSLVSMDIRDPIALLKFRRAAGPFPLAYLLRYLRTFGATDPRDKIFALLGIASDAKDLGLYPDYRKSCEEVYTEVTLTLIRNGHYDLLSLSHLSTRIDGLPSWSPDWSIKNRRHPLQESCLERSARPLTTVFQPAFSASGSKMTLNSSGGSGIIRSLPLLLHGTILSTVGQLGMVWEGGNVGAWLHDLDRLSYLLMVDTSKTNDWRQKTVWRTAVADQEIRQGNKKPRLSEEKLSSVHEALKDRDLSHTQVQTLIEAGLGDYYEQLRQVAAGRRPLSMSDGFYGIGPHEAQAGDVLVILVGAQVPYIMRRYGEGNRFLLVGEACIQGVMDGEAMRHFPTTQIITLV